MKIDKKFIRILGSGYYEERELDQDLGFLKQHKSKRCLDCGKAITEYSRCKECYFRNKDEDYL